MFWHWQGGHPGDDSGLGLGRKEGSAVAETPRAPGAWGSLGLGVRALGMLVGRSRARGRGVHDPL